MNVFSERIHRCAEEASLTVADLTRWFDRPRATVDTWVNGRTPRGPAGITAELDLRRLELCIFEDGFRIPVDMRQRARIAFLMEWRNGAREHYRVPHLHPAA